MSRASEAVRHVGNLEGMSSVETTNIIRMIYDPKVDESFFGGVFAGINVRPLMLVPFCHRDRMDMINDGALVFAIAYEMGFCLDKYISSVCFQSPKKIGEECPLRVLLEMVLGFAIASPQSEEDQADMVLRVAKIRDAFRDMSYLFRSVGFLPDDLEAFKLCVGVLAEESVAQMLFSRILHDQQFIHLVSFKEILDIIADIYAKKYFRRLEGHGKVNLAKRFFT